MQPSALCVRTPRTETLFKKPVGALMPEGSLLASLRRHHSDQEEEAAPHDDPYQVAIE